MFKFLMRGNDAKIPFSTFDGTLKCHRPESLTPFTATVMEFACPAFLDVVASKQVDPRAEELGKLAEDRGFETSYVNDEPRRRRYAGDITLPRGSYYGVCRDEGGRDNGAVANEMMAYRVPEKTGYVWIWDQFDPESARHFGVEPRHSFVFQINDVKRFREKYGHQSLPSSNDKAVAFEIPYHVERHTIEKVIDLRLPRTREWFFKLFKLGDGEFYKKPEGSNVSNFYEMLPALTRLDLGGAYETKGVGHWMRRAEVNALVFPSARCNVGAHIRESELVDHYGWNLIDYRGAPKPMTDAIVNLSPWHTEVMRGIQCRVAGQPEIKGSFSLHGVEEFHREFFHARLANA